MIAELMPGDQVLSHTALITFKGANNWGKNKKNFRSVTQNQKPTESKSLGYVVVKN